jgi:hypothetical protein
LSANGNKIVDPAQPLDVVTLLARCVSGELGFET